jgi:hypothetical protein
LKGLVGLLLKFGTKPELKRKAFGNLLEKIVFYGYQSAWGGRPNLGQS